MEYSKEEILEIIDRTKERYRISDMAVMGEILGETHHNWYYYYKNSAKKTPYFLDMLLYLQDPFDMSGRIVSLADSLMARKHMEKKDMKRLGQYMQIMSACVGLESEKFKSDLNEGAAQIKATQDPQSKMAYINDTLECALCNVEHMNAIMAYMLPMAIHFVNVGIQGIREGINAWNDGKENFDLEACYAEHCGTPEFEMSRKRGQTKEEEKQTCWYRVRCNNIKLCKVHEYSLRAKELEQCWERLRNNFAGGANATEAHRENAKIWDGVTKLLSEMELPDE